MRLPVVWLLDYLDLAPGALPRALHDACARWGVTPHQDPAQTLGALLTFAGFACEGVEGAGPDAVLNLDVLANRPDAQCVLGLAREAAAILRVPLKAPPAALKEGGPPAGSSAQVRVEDPRGCPRYTARVIRGVKVGPSPEWLQARLRAMGLVPRNNVVDVTNFVLFEMNQPLHAFDLNKLAGRQVIVRRARAGERFTPLYGEVPPLTAETLVIADAERAVAVAGVIGGAGSEVSAETTDLLLESAYFDPGSTRRTCRRLKVGTDASYRFERGIDVEAVALASARAARLITEVAGGQVAPGVLDSNPSPRQPRTLALRHPRLERLAGMTVPLTEAVAILRALGCEVDATDAEIGSLRVRVPSWRRGDLEREADLIEEVARIHGYNHVPAVTAMSARIPARSALETATDRAREILTALGYFECVTDSLVDPRWPAPAVWGEFAPLALDPRSVLREDHSVLRGCLLVSLLSVQRHNQGVRAGTSRLFECGKVFLPSAGQARPEERHALGLLDEHGGTALADAVRRLPEALELRDARIEIAPCEADSAPPFLSPAAACRVILSREHPGAPAVRTPVGWLGLAAPALGQAFDLKRAPAVAELNLDALAACETAPRRAKEIPAQPEVTRDVAMVVDEAVTWREIEEFAASFAEPLRDRSEPPRFLSVFRGQQVGAGKKSVAFSLVYRLSDRSLTDEEVNTAHGRFVEALLKRFSGALRA